ncbi:MucR family transcriptional regulator [Sphingomonas sp. 2R-10]|uniref:MucR family transcriptional regulator n=1 Tax=Sphingomonas sp. 2R-10 TaxID=3045148 RepID=UPI000F78D98E|nr:MucR family transcriptional regulator [Sphingomonas sp. 2R-10]MDJ0277687.1 MucR family transcriptional regulator [Sphingomonas sp. 2R-10]
MADAEQPDYTTLTVQLLTAYVSNNTVPIDQLSGLIEQTRATLAKRDEVPSAPEAEEQDFTPAVSARKSLASREHIVSMIDGKPYRTLKRHLSTHGLTPADYRARYKLPDTYPMVAPAYSEARRETAKRLGLGRKPAISPSDAPEKPRRGRRPAGNVPEAS